MFYFGILRSTIVLMIHDLSKNCIEALIKARSLSLFICYIYERRKNQFVMSILSIQCAEFCAKRNESLFQLWFCWSEWMDGTEYKMKLNKVKLSAREPIFFSFSKLDIEMVECWHMEKATCHIIVYWTISNFRWLFSQFVVFFGQKIRQ